MTFEEKIQNKVSDINTYLGHSVDDFIKHKYELNIYNAWKGFLSEQDANRLSSCQHGRDSRTIYQFARDIILAWVCEDLTVEVLSKKFQIKAILSGADSYRQFLPNQKVRSSSDFRAVINGSLAFIEAISDHTRYIEKNNELDFRDNKLEKIIETKVDTYISIVDWKNMKVALIKVDEKTEFEKIYNYLYGKYCSRMPIQYVEEFFDIFDDEEDMLKNQISMYYLNGA